MRLTRVLRDRGLCLTWLLGALAAASVLALLWLGSASTPVLESEAGLFGRGLQVERDASLSSGVGSVQRPALSRARGPHAGPQLESAQKAELSFAIRARARHFAADGGGAHAPRPAPCLRFARHFPRSDCDEPAAISCS